MLAPLPPDTENGCQAARKYFPIALQKRGQMPILSIEGTPHETPRALHAPDFTPKAPPGNVRGNKREAADRAGSTRYQGATAQTERNAPTLYIRKVETMTDLQRARLALEYIRKSGEATPRILTLVRHGRKEFTFSPIMPEPKD